MVLPLSGRKLPPCAGNKAANLRFLLRAGLPVPQSYVCTPDTCRACGGEDSAGMTRLRDELSAFVRPDRSYAVRSSAAGAGLGRFMDRYSVLGLVARARRRRS